MNTKQWDSAYLGYDILLIIVSVAAFLFSFISLLIHPERYGFTVATVFGFIGVILFFISYIERKTAVRLIKAILYFGGYRYEKTVFDYQLHENRLITVEGFHGHLKTDQQLILKVSTISIYETGDCLIIHEYINPPFFMRNDTVRLFSKES